MQPVADGVLATVRDYAWPAILAVLDAPGYPPEPGRRPREYPAPPDVDDAGIIGQLDRIAMSGGSPADADFAMLASPDAYFRLRTAEHIGAHELDDPRAVPALLSVLEHDPVPGVRRNAAWVLAPAAAGRGDVRDALAAAAAQDEDVQVRWAARYSLRRAGVLQANAGS